MQAGERDDTFRASRSSAINRKISWNMCRGIASRYGIHHPLRLQGRRQDDRAAAQDLSSQDAPAAVRDVYRDAVDAPLKRCTPLHFSTGMAGAVAGRPIAIRFVDDRTIDNGKDMR